MEKDRTRPVYIIGHKNPDTDSICSALAYAYLKNHTEGGGYIAARAGQLNQETQYVLNFFQAEAPVYVADFLKAGLESYAPLGSSDPSDYQGTQDRGLNYHR